MFNKCIYFNLVTLTRKISQVWQEAFARLGLSPSHGYLLFAITELPDASQKELSSLLELDASTITRFIDTLVAKGLIKRVGRGRGCRFRVTTAGLCEYQRIKLVMDELYNNMQEHFGSADFSTFVESLRLAKGSFTGAGEITEIIAKE